MKPPICVKRRGTEVAGHAPLQRGCEAVGLQSMRSYNMSGWRPTVTRSHNMCSLRPEQLHTQCLQMKHNGFSRGRPGCSQRSVGVTRGPCLYCSPPAPPGKRLGGFGNMTPRDTLTHTPQKSRRQSPDFETAFLFRKELSMTMAVWTESLSGNGRTLRLTIA